MAFYQTIPVGEIHDTHRYDIHTFLIDEPIPQDLLESINVSGILHPPIVLASQDGSYDVICGRKRLNCATTILKKSECFCRLLSHKIKTEGILNIVIEDQFTNGKLSVIEQATFIDLCKKLLPEKRVLKTYLKSIPQGRITNGINFLSPLNMLDISLQKEIHYSIISEKIIGELQKYNAQEQAMIAGLIKTLKVGLNNQKKLLGFITELHFRNEKTPSSIFADRSFQEILDNPVMNNPQKLAHIFSILHKMCYPLLSSAEDLFEKEVDESQLPKQCQLKASKSFEKDELVLTINFDNMNSFKQVWPDIKKILP